MPAIFLEQSPGHLVPLAPQEYEAEEVLQKLLADYPELLLGDSTGGGSSYLLIRREMGVPSEEGGSDQWSLDHLFLDQTGTPTLVEVKRSTDTRIRREVVGQMLDYAANAVLYWPVDRIIEDFRTTCQVSHKDADDVLQEHLAGTDQTPEDFWEQVSTNLKAKKIRLIFVADAIPRELRTIVEFLNEAMSSADVLAVEIKRFQSETGLKTFVASVIGNTTAAMRTKGASAELGAKGQLYQEFWPIVRDKFAIEAPGWVSPARKIPTGHELSLTVGRTGIWFGVQFTKAKHLQVTLYMLHDAIKAPLVSPFTELMPHKSEIEAAFGGPLVWDAGGGKGRSSVAAVRPGQAEILDRDQWSGYADWLVTSVIKFRAAIQPFVDSMPK